MHNEHPTRDGKPIPPGPRGTYMDRQVVTFEGKGVIEKAEDMAARLDFMTLRSLGFCKGDRIALVLMAVEAVEETDSEMVL